MHKIGDMVSFNQNFDILMEKSTSMSSAFGVNGRNWRDHIIGKQLRIIGVSDNINSWDGYTAEQGVISLDIHEGRDWVFPVEWFSRATYEIFEEDFLL